MNSNDRQLRRSIRQVVAIYATVAVLLLFAGYLTADWWIGLPTTAEARFVGRGACIDCHAPQAARFAGSDHDRAMDLATLETVLGDFDDAELEHHGVVSRMFRRDGKFMIYTEGPDGKLADFEIKYVFGVDPLQQYMVEFDRPADAKTHEISRLQVLRISWDTHRQKWFHLNPPDVKEKLAPGDDLHWTGISQRWNAMCADCHSTNLERNFHEDSQKYHTTFSEIDVSCEACHGPASLHVQLANNISPFWDRRLGKGIANLKTPKNIAEVEMCAQCHSRRRIVHANFRPGEPLDDFYAVETLQSEAYHGDGSNRDEAYEYGSFTQSKMFHKNIRCSDCHDSHSGKLYFSGNKVCTSCHQHPASKYDSPAHYHHADGSTGGSCVECHMPATNIMEIDARRDHSLRVPRPDLSQQFGTPNACTACHLSDKRFADSVPLGAGDDAREISYFELLDLDKRSDRAARDRLAAVDSWCATATSRWYKPYTGDRSRKEDRLAPAVLQAEKGDPRCQQTLASLIADKEIPGIARATSVARLAPFARPGSVAMTASIAAAGDVNPQVRAAAIANLQTLEPLRLREHGVPLLSDSSRTVRAEAARVMAPIAKQTLRNIEIRQFEAALAEYFQSLDEVNDLPGSHLAHGITLEQLRETEQAEQQYRLSLRLGPDQVGARSNLAALLDTRVAAAKAQASEAMKRRHTPAAVAAMDPVAALQVTIEQLRREELQLMQRDAAQVPANASLQHRLGLLHYLLSEKNDAQLHLQNAADLEPNNAHFHFVLAMLLEHEGDLSAGLSNAKRAWQLWPGDNAYRELVDRIKAKTATSKQPSP